ncbi:MAG: hypothetical protein EOO17_03345 [Chloroflexi bacterium]|nr:MAG: hypothetical protein EOO17_03345 [Chloroflexota bacterium]
MDFRFTAPRRSKGSYHANEKVVRVLRDGLFENVQDFMELFRDSEAAQLEYCDTEVAVIIPISDHEPVMRSLEKQCVSALVFTPGFFHPKDLAKIGERSQFLEAS